jgi:hypothetical protein
VFELVVLIYAVAVGFVAAGIATSFRQLLTAEPPRLSLIGERWTTLAATLAIFAVTGPLLVFRAVVSGRLAERRSLAWTIGGITIVGLWSCCLGILVMGLVMRLVMALVT